MGVYPGSSVIAYDTAASIGVEVRLSLWDTSQPCVESLSSVFGAPHQVHDREAQVDDEDVRAADFLLIDPPDKTLWPMILSVLRAGKATRQPTLVWLPLTASDGDELDDEASTQCRNEARDEGCEVLRVCWEASGSHTIGCLLAYRLSPAGLNAVRAAVCEVVSLVDWRCSRE